jgi:hypothetical protein
VKFDFLKVSFVRRSLLKSIAPFDDGRLEKDSTPASDWNEWQGRPKLAASMPIDGRFAHPSKQIQFAG